MVLYAISLQPLIARLGISSDVKQCWYADDASGSGSLKALKKWWDELTEAGPIWDTTQTLRNVGLLPNLKRWRVLEQFLKELRLTSLPRVKGIWGQPRAPENIWKNMSVAKWRIG